MVGQPKHPQQCCEDDRLDGESLSCWYSSLCMDAALARSRGASPRSASAQARGDMEREAEEKSKSAGESYRCRLDWIPIEEEPGV